MELEVSSLLARNFDFTAIKKEILESYRQCQARGLLHSTKYFAELLVCLKDFTVDNDDAFVLDDPDKRYLRCFAFFTKKEYERAAYFAKGSTAPKTKFIYFYSKYQACETKRADNFGETIGSIAESRGKDLDLKTLYWELKNDPTVADDGYCLYLYGVVQRILGLYPLAMKTLENAIKLEPFLWAAWVELALICKSKTEVFAVSVPYSWITLMFLGTTLTAVDPSYPLVQRIWEKLDQMFPECPFVMTQMAVALNGQYPPAVEKAERLFLKVRERDPCRLDNLDTYSNILYVSEKRRELTSLAQEMHAVDPHKSETCGVMGNVYSFRRQHAAALLYFKKAIKININFFPAWTFMGHEYAAIKNYHAAIHCYNQALEVNKRDHRAWFSLSMMYDQLKMLYYAMYYQQRAQNLRPTCPRMMLSLAERYEKLLRYDGAVLWYRRTYSAAQKRDFKEASVALFKLARVYSTMREVEKARDTYIVFVKFSWGSEDPNNVSLTTALMFLCDYYALRDMKEAHRYFRLLEQLPEAQECLRGVRERFRSESPPPGPSGEQADTAEAGTSDSMVMDTSLQ